MAALCVLLVVGSLLAVAGAHAYLTQGQLRLNHLQDQLSTQLARHRDLELRVADLEQPVSVLSQAQKQGLVVPSNVDDLPQVNPSAPSSATSDGSEKPAAPAGSASSSGGSEVASRSGGR